MRRINKEDHDFVEEAIVLADCGKTYEAALVCKDHNIPIDVAYRVIVTPSKRRPYPKLSMENQNGQSR